MPNRGTRWTTGAIAVVVLGLAIVWVLFVPASDWLANHDVGPVTGSLRETALDNARGRLLTLGAGLFAAAALIFTARNFVLSRERQVTDRYGKAIEQLGSDKLDVRIGGIYALERIALDSARDHPAVMEVLTAFVREHSREQWPPLEETQGTEAKKQPRPDVQAAVTVVGRRNARRDIRQADLSGSDLRGADLASLNLRAANLSRATLAGANLDWTSLADADLREADLTGADLHNVDLGAADLRKAILKGAVLRRINLGGTAVLKFPVKLAQADLRDADLSRARLPRLRRTPAQKAFRERRSPACQSQDSSLSTLRSCRTRAAAHSVKLGYARPRGLAGRRRCRVNLRGTVPESRCRVQSAAVQ